MGKPRLRRRRITATTPTITAHSATRTITTGTYVGVPLSPLLPAALLLPASDDEAAAEPVAWQKQYGQPLLSARHTAIASLLQRHGVVALQLAGSVVAAIVARAVVAREAVVVGAAVEAAARAVVSRAEVARAVVARAVIGAAVVGAWLGTTLQPHTRQPQASVR